MSIWTFAVLLPPLFPSFCMRTGVGNTLGGSLLKCQICSQIHCGPYAVLRIAVMLLETIHGALNGVRVHAFSNRLYICIILDQFLTVWVYVSFICTVIHSPWARFLKCDARTTIVTSWLPLERLNPISTSYELHFRDRVLCFGAVVCMKISISVTAWSATELYSSHNRYTVVFE